MVELFDYYCNNYVVSNGKEAILIDAGLPESTISYIRKVYDLKAVLLTHGHYDHIEGLKYLKDLDIYIHEDEEAFLYDSNL